MYTGWIQPFRVNRPLSQQERDIALLREPRAAITPAQRMALISINSTYLDWIDRRHLFRGNPGIFLATAIGTGLTSLFAYLIILIVRDYDGLVDLLGLTFMFGIIFPVFKFVLFKDYFSYTYFPIRFNRRTRMVHVFRHNGAGGVLSVPWDEVFFHIGQGTTRKDFRDIRGEVLDGDIVKDTFALGHVNSHQALLEMWEFIRRYMDEGPEAAAPHPLDRYVELSVTPSWKNCHLATSTYYAAGLPPAIQLLVSPLVLLFTLTRWVVLRTCRQPVFPPDIEATCQVNPDDPNVWPMPQSSGEFAATVPGLVEHAKAKALRNWQAERQRQGRLP